MANDLNLTLKFHDCPPKDKFLLRLGESGTAVPAVLEGELRSRVQTGDSKKRYLFAAILQSDNGVFLVHLLRGAHLKNL